MVWSAASAGSVVTERFEITGVVQGVGFRPFVYRLARELGLAGFVGNDATQVFAELCGPPSAIDEFAARLLAEQPPLARIADVGRRRLAGTVHAGFEIVDSTDSLGERTLVPPDTAMCDDCRAEFRDPADRRYRHPFITCTNCGPRFTIIDSLPYDRPATTMADFEMCDRCASEYCDPADRRYHAQPIACHDCGPTLRIATATDPVGSADDPMADATEMLRSASVVAVKGLGGFHLACDATSDEAVGRLRDRKHRPDKPFAVMVRDVAEARRLAVVSDAEATQLRSPARPVVLMTAVSNELSELVAPGNPLIGVMLPSTPLHELLCELVDRPLVMTSANRSGEPLVHRDVDVSSRLSDLCDGALTHDRRIEVPCDDSVVRVAGDVLLPIRRARGYAPMPLPIGSGQRSVLAVGAELKNTFCLASRQHAWMSQHIGDMENIETLEAFEHGVEQFSTLYDVQPDVVAVDAHPGYATARWARRHHADRVVEVQHHHAHVAAVMAEHECEPTTPVTGVAFDGTGYGTDGTIWGGEVLVADALGFDRVAHLVPVPLPGGDAAVRHPSRVALAHLDAAGVEWSDDLAPVQQLSGAELVLLRQQLDRDVACVPTTSMGRLFDAVASLLDLRHDVTYEAQAAIDLEAAAARCTEPVEPYAFDVDQGFLDQRPVVAAIVRDLRAGRDVDAISLAFHDAVAEVVVEMARAVNTERGIDIVALSGGVFQNALLTRRCVDALRAAGLRPLTHHLVPPNDGGLALGQAFVAAHGSASRDSISRRVPTDCSSPTSHSSHSKET